MHEFSSIQSTQSTKGHSVTYTTYMTLIVDHDALYDPLLFEVNLDFLPNKLPLIVMNQQKHCYSVGFCHFA